MATTETKYAIFVEGEVISTHKTFELACKKMDRSQGHYDNMIIRPVSR